MYRPSLLGVVEDWMMKKIVTILILLFCLINSRAIAAETATVYVMHAPYAFVIAENSGGDFSEWGGKDKWDDIFLWGRCPISYYEDNYEYKWTYGDDEETGWRSIDAFHGDFDSSYKYLKSDRHQYKTRAGEPITYYTANLIIRDNMEVVISTTPVLVKAVDFDEVTNANGFPDSEEAKRLMMESMAKGRGLKWLYIKQKSNGSWPAPGGWCGHPVANTGMALSAYLVYGHSVYDPHGTVDIFVKTVDDGLNYIFSQAVRQTAVDSDINGNGYKVQLHGNNYQHGIVMLALAASYNFLRAASDVTLSGGVIMPYAEVIQDVVDWAAWSQIDGQGGYIYGPNGSPNDLSVTQWPVLGMAAIEDVWGFKAPDFVRERMVTLLIWRMQYQNDGGGGYDGGAFYRCAHGAQSSYTPAITFGGYDGCLGRWMVGTNALLQTMFYVSMDTSSAITACQCDSGAGNYCGIGHEDRDCTINEEDISFSCERVKHAIDYIGRNWTVPLSPHSSWNPSYPFLYGMYGVMKALRLYNYERGGVNDGVLYSQHSFTDPPSGDAIQWEDEYSDFVLDDQKTDGHWEGNWCTSHGYLATAWALLMLAETVYYPSSIKTELLENMIQHARNTRLGDWEIRKIGEKE